MGTVSPPEPALLLASSATDGEEQDVEHEQSELLTARLARFLASPSAGVAERDAAAEQEDAASGSTPNTEAAPPAAGDEFASAASLAAANAWEEARHGGLSGEDMCGPWMCAGGASSAASTEPEAGQAPASTTTTPARWAVRQHSFTHTHAFLRDQLRQADAREQGLRVALMRLQHERQQDRVMLLRSLPAPEPPQQRHRRKRSPRQPPISPGVNGGGASSAADSPSSSSATEHAAAGAAAGGGLADAVLNGASWITGGGASSSSSPREPVEVELERLRRENGELRARCEASEGFAANCKRLLEAHEERCKLLTAMNHKLEAMHRKAQLAAAVREGYNERNAAAAAAAASTAAPAEQPAQDAAYTPYTVPEEAAAQAAESSQPASARTISSGWGELSPAQLARDIAGGGDEGEGEGTAAAAAAGEPASAAGTAAGQSSSSPNVFGEIAGAAASWVASLNLTPSSSLSLWGGASAAAPSDAAAAEWGAAVEGALTARARGGTPASAPADELQTPQSRRPANRPPLPPSQSSQPASRPPAPSPLQTPGGAARGAIAVPADSAARSASSPKSASLIREVSRQLDSAGKAAAGGAASGGGGGARPHDWRGVSCGVSVLNRALEQTGEQLAADELSMLDGLLERFSESALVTDASSQLRASPSSATTRAPPPPPQPLADAAAAAASAAVALALPGAVGSGSADAPAEAPAAAAPPDADAPAAAPASSAASAASTAPSSTATSAAATPTAPAAATAAKLKAARARAAAVAAAAAAAEAEAEAEEEVAAAAVAAAVAEAGASRGAANEAAADTPAEQDEKAAGLRKKTSASGRDFFDVE